MFFFVKRNQLLFRSCSWSVVTKVPQRSSKRHQLFTVANTVKPLVILLHCIFFTQIRIFLKSLSELPHTLNNLNKTKSVNGTVKSCYPSVGCIMQLPEGSLHGQGDTDSSVSCTRPKLWPISWAMIVPTRVGCVLVSCDHRLTHNFTTMCKSTCLLSADVAYISSI